MAGTVEAEGTNMALIPRARTANGTRLCAKRLGRHIVATLLIFCGLMVTQCIAVADDTQFGSRDGVQCGSDSARLDRQTGLTEKALKTANGSIGYFRFGHGDPVVLVTGYRASMAEWNAYFLTDLAKRHEVIVFDNRGIGLSHAHSDKYGARDLARDTAGLIRGLKLKNVTVLGWSMGGIIVQQLALDEPSLASKIVLLSSLPPGRGAEPLSDAINQVLSGHGSTHFNRVMGILFPASVVQDAKACFVDDMFAPLNYASPKISENVGRAQAKIMRDWTKDNSAYQRLRSVTVPALILVGDKDDVLSPRNSTTLSQVLQDATLVQVEGGGHALMYQYPQRLADRIEAFISK